MKIARLPLIVLPIVAIAMTAIIALFVAMIDQAHLRGAYQVWQENETFAAATIALLAAMYAARPVYMQVRAQSVQASLDLLHRTEADTEACIDACKRLYQLRQVAIMLSGTLNAFSSNDAPATPADLKEAIGALMAITPRDLRALAERPTITSADRMKIITLSCVLSLAQQIAADILASEHDGVFPQEFVTKERELIVAKLAGLFSLSSEITEDLEAQEHEMRDRALKLRQAADNILA
jgi:hypothetical protein